MPKGRLLETEKAGTNIRRVYRVANSGYYRNQGEPEIMNWSIYEIYKDVRMSESDAAQQNDTPPKQCCLGWHGAKCARVNAQRSVHEPDSLMINCEHS